MSRKMLIIGAGIVLLLATLVAPAVTVSPEVDDAVSVEVEVWSTLSASPSVVVLPIRLDGDCEGGGSGGCPNVG